MRKPREQKNDRSKLVIMRTMSNRTSEQQVQSSVLEKFYSLECPAETQNKPQKYTQRAHSLSFSLSPTVAQITRGTIEIED